MDDVFAKYRAWDKIQEKMFYPEFGEYFQIHSNTDWSLMRSSSETHTDIVLTTNIDLFSTMYNGILMQYVGWEDKTGKEMYFGDIIKYQTFYDDEPNESGTAILIRGMNCGVGIQRSIDQSSIMFANDESNYVFHTYADLDGIGTDFWQDENIFDVEVVGNIYEDAHLINH
jgi:hypothetical protein